VVFALANNIGRVNSSATSLFRQGSRSDCEREGFQTQAAESSFRRNNLLDNELNKTTSNQQRATGAQF
jgi:hypothetical protein